MKRLAPVMVLAMALAAIVFATSCAPYSMAVDERSIGTMARDKRIANEILAKFLDDDIVSGLSIDPFSYDGHVYLVGEYTDNTEKTQAIAIARKVDGVRKVTTYLLRERSDDPCGTATRVRIKSEVRAALIGDKDIWSTNVDIAAVQCDVVLLGIVGKPKEIEDSVAHAKSVEGVARVKSFLKAVR